MTLKPDYGIDAPGLVRLFFAGGGVALIGFIIANQFRADASILTNIGIIAAAVAAFYMLFMGCLMVYWSRVQKIIERDKLLNLINWRGDEQVLDVGCGRGLLLIGSAQKLTTGKAIGIDIWAAKDQYKNSPNGVIENAQMIGVDNKIEILTADMRNMPFDDHMMDVVMSHWAVHNLDSKADRDKSLAEMARVLKPDGTLLLIDIENRTAYVEKLESLSFENIRIIVSKNRDIFLGLVSFGSFRPAAIMAQLAGSGLGRGEQAEH